MRDVTYRHLPCYTQQKRDGCYDNSIWLFQLHVLLVVRRLLCKIDMYASTFISHIVTFSYDVYASFICDSIVINPRRACAARVTVVGSVCLSVCLSVCVSVKSHLTNGASVHPENAVTYSAGNEGPNICGVFSENAPLQS